MSCLLHAILSFVVFLSPPIETNAARADSSVLQVEEGAQRTDLRLLSQRSTPVHLFTDEKGPEEVGLRETRKRPAGALLRSLGSTVIPAGLGAYLLHRDGTAVRWIGGLAVVGGGLVGPSAGHFYARNEGQAWNGIAVRGGAGIVGALAAWGGKHAVVDGACPDSEACNREPDSVLGGALVGVLLGSAATALFRTVYDLATTWRAAQRYNAARSFSTRPTLNPIEGHAGLALRWMF